MMKKREEESRFVVCVCNEGYPASLEVRKIYQVVPDTDATGHRYLRVVDESGEDYVYPAHFFVPISLPQSLEKAFALAA
ncbi:MAG: hypothetical protein HY318_20495 [Armatimonadetes bacterium]|nr:hypothetical protein [Armatimonadota bacterium]